VCSSSSSGGDGDICTTHRTLWVGKICIQMVNPFMMIPEEEGIVQWKDNHHYHMVESGEIFSFLMVFFVCFFLL